MYRHTHTLLYALIFLQNALSNMKIELVRVLNVKALDIAKAYTLQGVDISIIDVLGNDQTKN